MHLIHNFTSILVYASSSFGRIPHFQMLAVMVLSQHRVSTSKTVSPRIPVSARCMGHVRMMCSAVCSATVYATVDVLPDFWMRLLLTSFSLLGVVLDKAQRRSLSTASRQFLCLDLMFNRDEKSHSHE